MLDPLELVRQAKNRHFAYKPLAETQKILGEGYTPSVLQGRDITKNPAGAAALAAQGVRGANTPQVQPNSPLNPVEPTANGQLLPGFADGGQVITKVSKVIEGLLKRFGSEALPTTAADASHDLRAEVVDPRKLDALRGRDPSLDTLLQGYSTAAHNGLVPDDIRTAVANKLESISPQEKLRRLGSQLNPDTGVDPYNSLDRLTKQQEAESILGQMPSGDHGVPPSMLMQPGFSTQRQAFAEGGRFHPGNSELAREIAATPPNPPIIPYPRPGPEDPTAGGSTQHEDMDPSSLKWIADAARKLGINSMSEDRARVATGIAKQFYGLDEHGKPVLGGKAWLSSQHGTPPRILDELTAIPGSLARLANAVFGGKIPENANVTPDERRAMERDLPVPKWSDDAAARVDALDKAAEGVTGVGAAHSLPEHIEDAAAMLATPFPASRVAGEAPMTQRIFEYLTPVRPPTMGRYATDSAILGGAGSALDKLLDRMSAKAASKDTSVDPEFEQAAMDYTNSHY